MKPLAPVVAAIAVLAAGLVTHASGGAPGEDARAGIDRAGPPVIIPDEARQCPEVMRGVSLVFRPISGGVALVFTSPRARQVDELRDQLREAAHVVEAHSKAVKHINASNSDQVRLPPLDISVNDVESGARVVVRAQRARDLPEVLELAHVLQLIWSRSDCHDEISVRRRPALPSMSA